MSQKSSITKPDVFCLMGPTASGKTALAVELVQQAPFDIVSVDSTQVYRGMDIGSGKPDAQTLALAPHRLIDINDPGEPYSAADFRSDAIEQVSQIVSSGRIPLLVGGTMLYFKVLRDGLAAMPKADQRVRAQIEQLAASKGWEAVHQKLAEVDPESAQRIHPNDPQRLQRALEVFTVTGKTMTELHRAQGLESSTGSENPFKLHFIAIQPQQREQLHDQIARRFMQMLDDGLIAEVETLYNRGDLSDSLPSIKSVGYRQVWQYLSGDLSFDEMVEKGIIATRQLAKRQFTWLRSWPELHRLECQPKKSLDKVLKIVACASI
jgi:tRNA dimethylallyltransferase